MLRQILDLKECTERVARWRRKLIEFDFEIFYRLGKYHKVAEKMFRLPQKASNIIKVVADVNDDILAYCVAGQISKLNTGLTKTENQTGPLLTTKEVMKTQVNDVLYLTLKLVLKNDGMLAVSQDALLCRKNLTDEAMQIIVCKQHRRTLLFYEHCTTLVGRPGTRWLLVVLRGTYYWPYKVSKVHELIFKSKFCRRHKSS